MLRRIDNEWLKKNYCFLLVSFPLLNMYATNIYTLSFADVVTILFSIVLIINEINRRKENKNDYYINYELLIIFIYICFTSVIVFYNTETIISQGMLSTLRYLYYLGFIIFFHYNYFDFSICLKIIKWVSLASAIFLIFQYFFGYFFRFYIPGTIPGLPLMRKDLLDFYETAIAWSFEIGLPLRPRSFFSEPAHFCQYVFPFLCLTLNKKNVTKKDWIIILIIVFSIFLSASSTGYILLALLFVYSLNIIILPKLKKIKRKYIVLFFVLLFLGVCLIIASPPFQLFWLRTFENGLSSGALARFNDYFSVFLESSNSIFDVLFGHGMVYYGSWIPSIPRLYYNFGLVGMFLFASLFFHCYKSNKLLAVIFALQCFSSELLMGHFIFIYIPFMISNNFNFCKRIKVEKYGSYYSDDVNL